MLNRVGVLLALCLVMVVTGAGAQSEAESGSDAEKSRFLVIYDSSNSMWGELADKSRKYEAGRTALAKLFETDLGNREVGFRAYGHRHKSDCRDSELIVPFADAATVRTPIKDAVGAIRPTGKTPITYSLKQGLADFDGRSGDILLISDGLETCDADPCELMREWRASNVDIRVHVVGVGLTHMERAAMACVADESSGAYFDANTEGDFTAALTEASEAIATPKEIVKHEARYSLIIRAADSEGRRYVVNGKLFKDGIEIDTVTSNGRNGLDGPGDYEIEVGPVLNDDSIYKPVRQAFSAASPGDTTVSVVVTRPAIVSAKFFEEGEEHRGSHVTSYQDNTKAFGFRASDEALAQPGTYTFKATPNDDNALELTETLIEGQHTELVFNLTKTIKFYVVFKLPNGEIVKRHSELRRNGEKLYTVYSGNGGRAFPGTYTLHSDDQNSPLTPVDIEITTDNQTIEVPLSAGFVVVTYKADDSTYTRPPDRAFIEPLERTNSSYASLNTPIHLAPGPYRVNPQTGLGFFDAQEIEIVEGETLKVEIIGKPLGQIVVNYAPSENYAKEPDRSSVYPLDGQGIMNGFMRPGVAKKFLPGRYRVKPDGYAGDIAEQETVVSARETTTVTLKLRSEE